MRRASLPGILGPAGSTRRAPTRSLRGVAGFLRAPRSRRRRSRRAPARPARWRAGGRGRAGGSVADARRGFEERVGGPEGRGLSRSRRSKRAMRLSSAARARCSLGGGLGQRLAPVPVAIARQSLQGAAQHGDRGGRAEAARSRPRGLQLERRRRPAREPCAARQGRGAFVLQPARDPQGLVGPQRGAAQAAQQQRRAARPRRARPRWAAARRLPHRARRPGARAGWPRSSRRRRRSVEGPRGGRLVLRLVEDEVEQGLEGLHEAPRVKAAEGPRPPGPGGRGGLRRGPGRRRPPPWPRRRRGAGRGPAAPPRRRGRGRGP